MTADVLARELPALNEKYPKFLMNEGIARAHSSSRPQNPADCLFAKMSANYSADLVVARRTLRFRRRARLLPMRMRDQQRPALDPHRQSGRPFARRAFCRWFGGGRLARQPHTTRWGKALAMGLQRS